MAKRSRGQLLSLEVTLPPYIKEQGGRGCAMGSPTPTGSRTPSFLVGLGEEEKERGGAAPLALNQFGLGLGGAPHTPLAALYFH